MPYSDIVVNFLVGILEKKLKPKLEGFTPHTSLLIILRNQIFLYLFYIRIKSPKMFLLEISY